MEADITYYPEILFLLNLYCLWCNQTSHVILRYYFSFVLLVVKPDITCYPEILFLLCIACGETRHHMLSWDIISPLYCIACGVTRHHIHYYPEILFLLCIACGVTRHHMLSWDILFLLCIACGETIHHMLSWDILFLLCIACGETIHHMLSWDIISPLYCLWCNQTSHVILRYYFSFVLLVVKPDITCYLEILFLLCIACGETRHHMLSWDIISPLYCIACGETRHHTLSWDIISPLYCLWCYQTSHVILRYYFSFVLLVVKPDITCYPEILFLLCIACGETRHHMLSWDIISPLYCLWWNHTSHVILRYYFSFVLLVVKPDITCYPEILFLLCIACGETIHHMLSWDIISPLYCLWWNQTSHTLLSWDIISPLYCLWWNQHDRYVVSSHETLQPLHTHVHVYIWRLSDHIWVCWMCSWNNFWEGCAGYPGTWPKLSLPGPCVCVKQFLKMFSMHQFLCS